MEMETIKMKGLSILLRKTGSFFHLFAQKIDPKRYKKPLTQFEKELNKWNKDSGEYTLRLNYSLSKDSIVFDLGGYKGEWASCIYSMYQCNVQVFEPHPSFNKHLNLMFRSNSKITVYPFGLGKETEAFKLYSNEFSSSIYNKVSDSKVDITIKKFIDFINKEGIKSIDLIKINIEGGEYDLLEHILETGFMENIKNLQIQFHNFVENSDSRMEDIQTRLSKTHKTTYQYNYVWENWERK